MFPFCNMEANNNDAPDTVNGVDDSISVSKMHCFCITMQQYQSNLIPSTITPVTNDYSGISTGVPRYSSQSLLKLEKIHLNRVLCAGARLPSCQPTR